MTFRPPCDPPRPNPPDDPGAPESPSAILVEFLKRVTLPPSTPDDFDPLKATPEERARFFIPPPPSPELQPLSYAFWSRLYAPPFRIADKPFTKVSEMTLSYLRSGPPAGRSEGSSNWSGAYISARDSETFTEVHGIWTVPTPQPRADAGPNETFNSSTWIGLDGQRRSFNASLPQLGTEQKVVLANGVPTVKCTTWMQWWSRDLPDNRPIELRVTVSPGDEIACSIVVDDPFTATFTLRNLTTGGAVVKARVASPIATPPDAGTAIPIRISGSTAEWITELPGDPDHLQVWRLPDYGSVLFGNCHAVSAASPGKPGRDRDLTGARLITMYETRREPSRTAKISIPQWVDATYTATSYRHVP